MNARMIEAMADYLADESSLMASSDEKAEFLLTVIIRELRADPAAVEAIARAVTACDIGQHDDDFERMWPFAKPEGELAVKMLCDYLER